jgi:hypothetical protein
MAPYSIKNKNKNPYPVLPVIEYARKHDILVAPHPPCYQDMAPCDYLFLDWEMNLKEDLIIRRTSLEIWQGDWDLLWGPLSKSWHDCWNQAIHSQGDYSEISLKDQICVEQIVFLAMLVYYATPYSETIPIPNQWPCCSYFVVPWNVKMGGGGRKS